MQKMTLAEACATASILPKILIDDRVIIRQETGGQDIVPQPEGGRIACDADDVAVLCGYADLKRAGYPVKLAGTIMSRIRQAMRDDPDEEQHTVVLLANGSTFTLPTSKLDLASGYTSGSHVVAATMVEVRNLRERVRRAIEVEYETA